MQLQLDRVSSFVFILQRLDAPQHTARVRRYRFAAKD
jgi:hypothetical protein